MAVHPESVCHRCGDTLDSPPLAGLPSSGLCRACRLASPPFARAVSFSTYEGRIRAAIHALKYDQMHPAAGRLGSMLATVIVQLLPETRAGLLVVPVPLHPGKHRQRGFNQARILAKSALGVLRKSHPEWRLALAPTTLMRLRATESQAGLTPHQRRQNVRGAFKVSDPSVVSGKHVLLVDDILTTGATARSAALALLKAGAVSVYVATLARARRANFNQAQAYPFGTMRSQPDVLAGIDSSSSAHQPLS